MRRQEPPSPCSKATRRPSPRSTSSADGLRAASAGWDGSVRVWDLRARTIARVLEGHGANVGSVRFSLDGQVLASGGWDGTARLWDPDSGKPLAVLSGHDGNVTAVAMHPAGRQVATGCDDHAVRLFDPRSKRPPRVLAGHAGEVTGLAFTADGRFLLSSSRDRSVRVWDVRRGETVRSLSHPAMVLGLALVPAGSLLATACADRTGRLWHLDWEPEADATSGEPAATVATTAPPRATRRSTTASAATTPGRASMTTTRASTLREDLSRDASGPVRALRPRAASAARRVPWRWIALGLAVLLAVVVSVLLTRKPAPPRLRLSPQMAGARSPGGGPDRRHGLRRRLRGRRVRAAPRAAPGRQARAHTTSPASPSAARPGWSRTSSMGRRSTGSRWRSTASACGATPPRPSRASAARPWTPCATDSADEREEVRTVVATGPGCGARRRGRRLPAASPARRSARREGPPPRAGCGSGSRAAWCPSRKAGASSASCSTTPIRKAVWRVSSSRRCSRPASPRLRRRR